jgi:hypothetical protein
MPRSTLIRLTAVGLSACALAPATAAAVPAIDGHVVVGQAVVGQAVAAGGGPGVTAQTLSSPAHTGGSDAVSGGGYTVAATGSSTVPQPPNFPTNTKALPVPAAKSNDDGIDTGVLIALGAAALLAIGGLGLALATRTTRRRQPA